MYIDEAHFYADADLRKTWACKGQPTLVPSSSPGRQKVNLYGAAAPAIAWFRIWDVDIFNGCNTARFLRQIRESFPGRRIDLVLDGGPQHHGAVVEEAFRIARIHPRRLQGYSPELNAIEPLWRWFREEVTYNRCHANARLLREEIFRKARDFSARPAEIRKRLKQDLSQIKNLL